MNSRHFLIPLAALALCSGVAAAQAPALNGAAELAYDTSTVVSLKGTLTSVDTSGPRSLLHVKVTEASPAGVPTGDWVIRSGTANTMTRAGILPDLQKASPISMEGYRLADKDCKGGCKAIGRKVSLPDGRAIFLGAWPPKT